MALTERLALLVTLDAEGAVKGFNDLGKAADRNLSKADQPLDRFASGFQKVGAGLAAGGGLALVGLAKAAEASEDARLSVVKLQNSIQGNSRLAGESAQSFIDLADAIQSKTAADGDAVVAGQAMLATFRVTGDQIRGLTPLVVDYARKFGVDLVAANSAVGKALDGSIGALKRNGVSIDEVLFKTDRYAAVTKALREQVGGFAESEGKTFAGSLQRLKNQLGDLSEGVGVGAVDAFQSVLGPITSFADATKRMDPQVVSLTGKVAAFGAIGITAAGGLSYAVGKVISMRENLSKLSGPFKNAEGGLNNFGRAAGALGLVGAVAGMAALANEAGKTVIDVNKAADALANMTAAGEEVAKQGILTAERFGQLDTIVSQLAASNGVAATSFVDLAEEAGIGADSIARYREEIEVNRRVQAQALIDQDKNTTAVQDTVDAMGGYESAASGVAGAADDITSAVDRQKEALDLAKDSLDLFKQGLEDAFGELDVQAATDRRAQAAEDMAQRFADAQDAVVQARQRVDDLLATPVEDRGATFGRDLAAAQEDVQDALAETARSLEGNSAAALANRDDLRGLVEDIGKVIEAHRAEGASLEELQTIRDLEKQGLIDQLEQLGFNRDEIGEYIAAIDAIPITKATTITADVAAAISDVERLKAHLAGLSDTSGVGVSIDTEKLAQRAQVNDTSLVVPTAGTPTATGATSVVNNVTVINPSQEPVSTTIRSVRFNNALVGG